MLLHPRVVECRDYMVGLRQNFHQNPELSFQENNTSQRIADELTKLGYAVSVGVGRTGVIGLLEGNKTGPVILIRADMDALPIQETNQVDYSSKRNGVMHACGHDGHMAVSLAVARLLAEDRKEIRGTVKFAFQPAEEIGQGAQAMITDGLLTNPVPDVALGLHLLNTIPVGKIALESGPVMAAFDGWQCIVKGSGGHGAEPHKAVNPISVLAQIVPLLESLPAKEASPFSPIVLSIGQIQAGSMISIIPESGMIAGSLRSYDPETRQRMIRRMEEIFTGIANASQCQTEIKITPGTPALVNDIEVTEVVRKAVLKVVGHENVVGDQKSMLSEDFSRILSVIPGCYFFVGSQNIEKGLQAPHHNPNFNFDENALTIGASILYEAVSDYLLCP